ncbi:MAG: flagellar hook-basal body complex protein [Clostridiales bacterium]|nr:flagellar hook-basal body complex protein [Clostridiales bacterium]
MNRAMFSGVAGMKTHQTRMDVIGNNIANVNTYGYKSQRAVFSDIFYQTLMGAAQGTASRGGRNPSTMGYGSTLGAIQTMMNQSSMQNTGFGLDVAITGEGFIQVMDPDGNIFYTKAGLLDYDANGYLVDINGNFVLGSTDVNGAPNTQKIKLDSIGAVSPTQPSSLHTIQGVQYTLTASNTTKDGNVGVTITSSSALPIGMKAEAVISETGSIMVTLNAGETFATLSELNTEINKAIVLANNNQPHVAGTFTLAMASTDGGDASTKFNTTIPAVLAGTALSTFIGGAKLSVSADFAGEGALTVTGSFAVGTDMVLTVTDSSASPKTYTVTIPNADVLAGGAFILRGATGDGTISISLPATPAASEAALAASFAASLGDHDYSVIPKETIIGLTGAQIAVDDFTVTPGSISGNWPVAGFSFKETSNDFAGRGPVTDFLMTPDDSSGVNTWIISMTIGGLTYEGQVPETAIGSTLLMKNLDGGGSFTLNIPRFVDMSVLYETETGGAVFPGGTAPLNLMAISQPYTGGDAKTALPSSNLGLSSVGFQLTGGTVGGVITLDELVSINIGADGTVSVSHADKGTMAVGKISLANFANPRGLMQSGSNYYVETVNSGRPVLNDPGTGGTGDLKANTLEMSNVDLSQEFADMIVTQRGFQANTRIITVSDSMLEELINLKR